MDSVFGLGLMCLHRWLSALEECGVLFREHIGARGVRLQRGPLHFRFLCGSFESYHNQFPR